MLLVRLTICWPNPTIIQEHTIELLTKENFHLVEGLLQPSDFANPDFYLSRHPDRALQILQKPGPPTVLFLNDVTAFQKHWACPKHKNQLLSWEPCDPRFRF